MPPLHDNVRLSVDEYRNKLYELMGVTTRVRVKHNKGNRDNRYWKFGIW